MGPRESCFVIRLPSERLFFWREKNTVGVHKRGALETGEGVNTLTTAVRLAVLRASHGRLGALVPLTAAPASVRPTIQRVARGGLVAAVLLAAPPAAVRLAKVGGALRRLGALLVLAALACWVRTGPPALAFGQCIFACECLPRL